jgi:GTP cyclohydrolase I
MQLQQAVNNVFVQLSWSLDRLSESQYVQPCANLNNHSIGQHVRHIIELFQCLEQGYAKGIVNYENRKRDQEIETQKERVSKLLPEICNSLDKPNKELFLEAGFDEHSSESMVIATNYYREIAYNLEHTIHHMALIRIGINELGNIPVSEDFGVASSTIKHRRQCAQ